MRFLFTFLVALAISTAAFAGNIYKVENITVSQLGADPVKVREQAMEAAQVKAFEELQNRLLAEKHITKRQEIPAKRIVSAVDAIDVVSEKSTARAYKASFNVIFSAPEVSRIFGIGYIEPTKDVEKFLVVPILAEGSDLKIWKHEWLKTWNTEKSASVILPLGDLQDLKNLKKEDLAANKYTGLFEMQKRYNATASVLIQAQYMQAKNSLDVQLEKIKGDDKVVINYEYPGSADISKNELFEAAANDISYRLENDKLTDESLSTSPNSREEPAPAVPQASTLPAQPVTPPAAAAAPAPLPAANQPLRHGQPVANPAAMPAPEPQLTPMTQGVTASPAPAARAVTPPAQPVPEPYSPSAPGTGFIGEKRAPADNNPVASAATAPIIGQNEKTDIFVNAPDLMAWNRIRNKIVKTRGVSELQIKSFTAGKAYITVGHSGDINSIKTGLAAQGLDLSGDGTNWEIKER